MRVVLLPLLLSACAAEPLAETTAPGELPAAGDGATGLPPSRVPVEPRPVEPVALPAAGGAASGTEPSGPGDNAGEGISAVVKRSQGRVKSCLERSLETRPGLNGRVSVGWTISAGRVTESHLVQNTTGDSALGDCVVAAVRTFRFDPSLSATVAEFPWVMSGG